MEETFFEMMKHPSKFKIHDWDAYRRLLRYGQLNVRIAFSSIDDRLKGMLHTIYYAGDTFAHYRGTRDEFLNCLERVPGSTRGYRPGYNLDTVLHAKHFEGEDTLPEDRVANHALSCARLVPEDDRFVAQMCGPYVYHPQTPCSCGRDPHKRWGSAFYTDHPDRGK